MTTLSAADTDLDLRRRRALYRAEHRGTKEMDVLLGRYARQVLPDLSGDALALFEKLLALPDPSLQNWVFGNEAVDQTDFAHLISDIRVFHGLDALKG